MDIAAATASAHEVFEVSCTVARDGVADLDIEAVLHLDGENWESVAGSPISIMARADMISIRKSEHSLEQGDEVTCSDSSVVTESRTFKITKRDRADDGYVETWHMKEIT